jgi:hypothetical protein
MVATNDDLLTELKKIKKLLKGLYAKEEDADTAISILKE